MAEQLFCKEKVGGSSPLGGSMEKPNGFNPEVITADSIKQQISESKEKIEAELARSANDWLSCYGSRVFAIEISIVLANGQGNLSSEEFERLKQNLEVAKTKLARYRKTHKNSTPSEDIREELLSDLNIFRGE